MGEILKCDIAGFEIYIHIDNLPFFQKGIELKTVMSVTALKAVGDSGHCDLRCGLISCQVIRSTELVATSSFDFWLLL